MKPMGESVALEKLHNLKTDFAQRIRSGYEHRAKSCATCDTRGACCLDAHFVNVHITKLEAKAIRNVIDKLAEAHRDEIDARIDETIARYNLTSEGDTFSKTFACPLFEKGIGCLVHERGKPLPCIAHACYENKEDLPPDTLLKAAEESVDELNELVYRKPTTWLPLPIAIRST
jgi:hypothetical protein